MSKGNTHPYKNYSLCRPKSYVICKTIATHGIILSPSFQVLNDLVEFKLGQIEVYTIPGNYCQVNYLIYTNIIIYHNK